MKVSNKTESQSQALEIPDHEVDFALNLFDESNPRSLISIVPPSVKEAMLRVPRHYVNMLEGQLYVQAGKAPVHSVLRMNFWQEYDNAQAELRKMMLKNIVRRFCGFDTFLVYLKQPYFVAYMLKPPLDYVALTTEALNFGLGRLREILELPLLDAKGRPNAKVIESVIRATAFLDLRVRGGITQRHEVKQLNFNLNSDVSKVEGDMQALTVEEIDRKIKKLKERQSAALREQERLSVEGRVAASGKKDIEVVPVRKTGN